MYQTVFFDLDGTLTDSAPGITHSVAHALKKWKIEVEDHSTLNAFVGPPLAESFAKYYGFTPEECKKAIEYYREYYTDKGMFENSVYPGIEELLAHLKNTGRKVVVATSKPEVFAVQILEHFHLAQYFDRIAGASMDENRVEKADVLRYAIEAGGYDLSEAVMVGDRENDIRGARDNQLFSVGVLYGYGSRAELEEAGADRIVETVEELKKYLDVETA